MHTLPPEHPKWKKRADWISKDFCGPKTMRSMLASMLSFCNGNSDQDIICHWCLPGCCANHSECVAKLLQYVIGFFSCGYPTPLLYRFKHFGPASSYMKIGCAFHNLVPRTFVAMQSVVELDSDLSAVIEVLLADTGRCEQVVSNVYTQEDLQQVVSEMLDNQVDYATQNSIRKKLICQELSSKDFRKNAFLIDTLLQPFEHGVNFCFKRTSTLHELCALGTDHPKHHELMQQSKGKFLHAVTGGLGKELISSFMTNLNFRLHDSIEIGLGGEVDDSFLQQVFNLVIVCCTDTWRRFVDEFDQTPFSLFQLIGLSDDKFIKVWCSLCCKFQACTSCVDDTFTATLLSAFPEEVWQGSAEQKVALKAKIESLLLDIAAWCPMTSDAVEVRNGNIQWLLSRRGNVQLKGVHRAVEESILQCLINRHQWVAHVLECGDLPSKLSASSIRKMSGSKSSNQFTKSLGKDTCPQPVDTRLDWTTLGESKVMVPG